MVVTTGPGVVLVGISPAVVSVILFSPSRYVFGGPVFITVVLSTSLEEDVELTVVVVAAVVVDVVFTSGSSVVLVVVKSSTPSSSFLVVLDFCVVDVVVPIDDWVLVSMALVIDGVVVVVVVVVVVEVAVVNVVVLPVMICLSLVGGYFLFFNMYTRSLKVFVCSGGQG